MLPRDKHTAEVAHMALDLLCYERLDKVVIPVSAVLRFLCAAPPLEPDVAHVPTCVTSTDVTQSCHLEMGV